eukprot:scaffold8750_cov36-Cyclotella_meneghiniana.AAC.1
MLASINPETSFTIDLYSFILCRSIDRMMTICNAVKSLTASLSRNAVMYSLLAVVSFICNGCISCCPEDVFALESWVKYCGGGPELDKERLENSIDNGVGGCCCGVVNCIDDDGVGGCCCGVVNCIDDGDDSGGLALLGVSQLPGESSCTQPSIRPFCRM